MDGKPKANWSRRGFIGLVVALAAGGGYIALTLPNGTTETQKGSDASSKAPKDNKDLDVPLDSDFSKGNFVYFSNQSLERDKVRYVSLDGVYAEPYTAIVEKEQHGPLNFATGLGPRRDNWNLCAALQFINDNGSFIVGEEYIGLRPVENVDMGQVKKAASLENLLTPHYQKAVEQLQ